MSVIRMRWVALGAALVVSVGAGPVLARFGRHDTAAGHAPAAPAPTDDVGAVTSLSAVAASSQAMSAPAISADGRWLAVTTSDPALTGLADERTLRVVVGDTSAGTWTLVSASDDGVAADAASGDPVISADGQVVAFSSLAGNLVQGVGGGVERMYVRDLGTGVVTLASVDGAGEALAGPARRPALSPDGRFVAFVVPSAAPAGDGSAVPSQGDGDRIVVFDRVTASIQALDAPPGLPGAVLDRPVIARDGRTIAYVAGTPSANGSDVGGELVLVDRTRGVSTVVSDGSGAVLARSRPGLSADGRYLVATEHFAGAVGETTVDAYEVFLYDLWAGSKTLVSVTPDGWPGALDSVDPTVSADGRYVLFVSEAAASVTTTTATAAAIASTARPSTTSRTSASLTASLVVYDRTTGAAHVVAAPADGEQRDGLSGVISGDGRHAAVRAGATAPVSIEAIEG